MSPARKPAETAADAQSWHRYTGSEVRTYLFADQPAILATPGDAYLLSQDPGDGAWEPCSAPKTTPASTETAE